MGAIDFYATSPITDVNEAYRRLCDEATAEHGRDPYNGTIATTGGYKVMTTTPMTRAAADRYVAGRLDDCDKRQCEVVPVGEAAKTRTKKATVTIPVNATSDSCALDVNDVAAALGVPAADIASWTITESSARYRNTTRAAGPARTVWTTSRGGSYPTKAAALAAAKAQMTAELERNAARSTSTRRETCHTIEVRKQTTCSPEAAVEATLTSWKAKVTVELTEGPLKFRYWLFYGMAAY